VSEKTMLRTVVTEGAEVMGDWTSLLNIIRVIK